mmetsp:Transcript_17716/g.16958  ORF Transcript_17716/g.16958 Transcript_17716/m.16958 type:complete len:142 (-) Transcript_17716:322-747(-)
MSMNHTGMSFYSQNNGKNIQSLTQNIDNLEKEQLRERLLVAETLMKKLYNRNKELEQFHQADQATDPNERKFDLKQFEQFRMREEELAKELEAKDKEIELLKQNQTTQDRLEVDPDNNYIKFLEERVKDCLSDNRRIVNKY